MNQKELFESMDVMWKFYGKDPNKAQAQIWFTVFQDCNLQDFQTAIGKYLSTTKNGWFPMPAEVKEHMDGEGVQSAQEAWLEAVLYTEGKNIQHAGQLNVEVNNPITNLIFSGRDSMKRKAFIEDYEAMARNGNLSTTAIGKYNSKINNNLSRAVRSVEMNKEYLDKWGPDKATASIDSDVDDEGYFIRAKCPKFKYERSLIEVEKLKALLITKSSPFSKLISPANQELLKLEIRQ